MLRQTGISYWTTKGQRQLTSACLPFGFAFALDLDEEPFLAGTLEASESRSILSHQLCRMVDTIEHTGHLPQLLVSLIAPRGA